MSLSSNFRTNLDSFPYMTAAKGCLQNRRADLQVHLIDATNEARRASTKGQYDFTAYNAAMSERSALFMLIARTERMLKENYGMSQEEIEGYMHDA